MIRRFKKIRKLKGVLGREGTTMVEYALIMPFFIMLCVACLEFARLSMMRNLAQDAAYYAARTAMVPGASVDEAQAEANRILAYLGTSNATVTINDGNPLDDDTQVIEVTVTVPLDENTLMFPVFAEGMTFESSARMRTERYDGFYDPYFTGD